MIKKITIGLMMAMGLAACSSDPVDNGGASGMKTVTLDIPVCIYSSNTEMSSRAASQGDPGNDEEFKAPLYLYIYAYIAEGTDGKSHELLCQTFTSADDTEASNAWTLKDEGTANERWQKTERVTFTLSSTFYNNLGSSRVFAVASREDLSSLLPKDASTAANTFSEITKFQSYTLDFSKMTGDDLKDVYSTPYNDYSTPYASTDNGLIVGDDNTLTCSAVKLYHVAAKVDFTWQVPEMLQSTTELASITCTGVPTTCKVFVPTDNPTDNTTSCVVLGSKTDTTTPVNELTIGNKWLGRAYAYMLQPGTGAVNYTVTYGGSANKQAASYTFTPSSVNNVFTGWYRVVATVK